MGAGKTLSLVAAAIVAVSTFLLTWMAVPGGNATGIGIIGPFYEMVTAPGVYMKRFGGVAIWVVYVMAALFICFLLSSVLLIFGKGSNACAILGSILPLVFGGSMVLDSMGLLEYAGVVVHYIQFFGTTQQLVTGIIPFTFPLMGLHIGAFLLAAGGVLGLISGFLPRSDYY